MAKNNICLDQKQMRRFLLFFLILNLGLICTAAGIAIFKSPNHFAFGGTSGVSVVLTAIFPQIDVGSFMWIVNIVLVLVGFVALGVRSMGWTIYSSFALSLYVSILELLFPLQGPMTDDTFLEFCFAVLLPALGSALVFNVGASTGGTDILAMVLQKHTSLEIGKALMCVDLGIVLIAAILFGPHTGMYCILGLAMKCTVVDSAIESLNLRKVCTVISKRPDAVKQFIIHKLHRSATEQKAYGAYTQEESRVLMTVLTRSEATQLRIFLRQVDPGAFITIVNSSEIIGKGFRSI